MFQLGQFKIFPSYKYAYKPVDKSEIIRTTRISTITTTTIESFFKRPLPQYMLEVKKSHTYSILFLYIYG